MRRPMRSNKLGFRRDNIRSQFVEEHFHEAVYSLTFGDARRIRDKPYEIDEMVRMSMDTMPYKLLWLNNRVIYYTTHINEIDGTIYEVKQYIAKPGLWPAVVSKSDMILNLGGLNI